jgi:hypothetical protein
MMCLFMPPWAQTGKNNDIVSLRRRYMLCMFRVVFTVGIISYETPLFILAMVPMMWFYRCMHNRHPLATRRILITQRTLLFLARRRPILWQVPERSVV